MTSRQARRERREAERKTRKAEYQAAKAEGGLDSAEPLYAVAPEAETIQPQPRRSRTEVNRANSSHSTGPRSATGKARSSQNSFKHGLYSTRLIMPGEDPAELDALKAELIAEHRPGNQTEHILVNEIAEQFWRIRRMRGLEAQAFTPENLDTWTENGLLALIQRTMAAAERGLHKALAALRQQRKDSGTVRHAISAEETPAAGFVPPKTEEIAGTDAHRGFVPPFPGLAFESCDDLIDLESDPQPLHAEKRGNSSLEQPAAA